MFNGSKDTQQAATQKLLEAIVHLRRASDALLSVQPIFTDNDFSRDVAVDRKTLNKLADAWEDSYLTAAREAFA
jgi:hypothetical protein